jgi:hypothetical protein
MLSLTQNTKKMLKRKRPEEVASSPTKKQKCLEEPIHGPRPIVNFLVGYLDFLFPCRILLDTGATGPVLSSVFVSKFAVPKVKRDVPAKVVGFTGEIMSSTGHAFTIPLMINSNGHQSEVSFEIAPLPTGIDAILPAWWLQEHKPVIGEHGEVIFLGSQTGTFCGV